ncbi:MAG: alpha/beta fold hydrolase [Hyphomonas sp.]
MSDQKDLHELIDRIYAAAIDPERYEALIDFWTSRIDASLDSDSAEAAAISEHLQRASELMLSTVAGAEDTDKADGQHVCAFFVNARGDIRQMTGSAQAAFGTLEGENIADLPFSEESLDRLRERLEVCLETEAEVLARLHRGDNDRGLLAALSFVHDEDDGEPGVLVNTSELAWHARMNEILRASLGFTQSESSVLKLFFEGYSVQEIAAAREASVHTIRAQMRSISSKTGTQAQAELMRLCSGLAAVCREYEQDLLFDRFRNGEENLSGPYPLEAHCGILKLQDNRVLDYSVFGPDDGIPVVFFHDDFFGDLWPADLAERAISEGLRVIIPLRPGYGATSPGPDGVKSYDTVTGDVVALLEHLGVSRFVGVSRTVGGIYAMRAMSYLSTRAMGLVAVSPTLPYLDGVDMTKLPRHTRFLTRAVLSNKTALRFFTMASRAMDAQIGRQRRLTLGYSSEVDKGFVSDPASDLYLLRGARLSDGGGNLSWYNDLKDLGDDEGGLKLYREATFPIHVVVGENDPTLRIDRAIAMREDNIPLELTVVDGAGELLFFTHGRAVVDALMEAFAEV